MQRKITMVTRLVDRFGCKKIRPNAARNKSPAKNRILNWFTRSWYLEKYQAKKTIRPIFTNSDGWICPMTGSTSQRLATPLLIAEYQHSQKKSQAGTIN